ncbi:MAG: nucleoside hydrolase [Chloroflexi bacterium]|nr:nucleoside hydrolase [Chloroflexota bacterium]
MPPHNVIIDCDTGVDDALALLLALRSPEFNVLGITNVAGNVPLNKVVRNTLVVVEHSGKNVPVYQGASHALTGGAETAEYAHGSDGLADIGFPEPKLVKQEEHAVDYLVRTFMESAEPIDLITLAPLTNIALALLVEPRLEEHIHSLVMMAGGISGGNTTPAAEFNVWVDPEAADAVFRSHIPMTMVALDPIRQGGGIYPEDVDRLEKCGASWCWMASRLLRVQRTRWEEYLGHPTPASPPDLAAMGVALDPTLAEAQMLPVVVETGGKHTRGMTLVDRREGRMRFRSGQEPNVNTVLSIDNARYRKLVLDTWLED